MLGMTRKPGIIHVAHVFLRLEELRDFKRRGIVTLHANVKRLYAAQDKPRIKRRQYRPHGILKEPHALPH